jgi:hypothetical protein
MSKHEPITPLDIMACYSPPSLAIHFRKSKDTKALLHKIQLSLKPSHTAKSLYDEVVKSHYQYIGPAVINKAQVLH